MVKGDQEKTLGIKNIGRKSNGRLKWCGVFDLCPFVCNFLTHNPSISSHSGDHDMLIPYVGTQAWIASLNLNISEDWQPWFVDGQVAGLVSKFHFFFFLS